MKKILALLALSFGGVVLAQTSLDAPAYLLVLKSGAKIECKAAPVLKDGRYMFTTPAGQAGAIPVRDVDEILTARVNKPREGATAAAAATSSRTTRTFSDKDIEGAGAYLAISEGGEEEEGPEVAPGTGVDNPEVMAQLRSLYDQRLTLQRERTALTETITSLEGKKDEASVQALAEARARQAEISETLADMATQIEELQSRQKSQPAAETTP